VGDRHYIVTYQNGYYRWNYASPAYSYGVSQFNICYIGEVGWGTYRFDTGSYYRLFAAERGVSTTRRAGG